MKRKGTKKIKFSQVSIFQKIAFVLLCAICILIQVTYLKGRAEKKRVTQIHNAAVYGEIVASEIQMIVGDYVNSTTIIKNFYLQYGDLFINDFPQICKRLIDDNIAIGSLGIAPDGVVQQVYPPETGHEDHIIGLNMLALDTEGKSSKAISSRLPTISSPRKIKIGGKEIEGFIIRNPIFSGDEFKGFSIVIIEYDLFTKQVDSEVNNEKSSFDIYLRRGDGTILMGDNSKEDFTLKKLSDRVKIPLEIPNEDWYLYVEPRDGWFTYKEMIPEILISCAIFIIILTMTFFSIIESSSRLFSYEHDSLTDLYTRSAFYRRIKKLFKENPDVSYNFVMTDVFHFKVANSIYGTEKCNELLKYLAECFKKDCYKGLCSRFSGDQFIFVMRDEDTESAEVFKKRYKEIIEGSPIKNIILKFGFYRDVDKSIPVNILADRALIAVKSISSSYDTISESFEGALSLRLQREQHLESKFNNALQKEDFKVWFQPKFDAKTQKLVGAEALVRWFDSETQKYIFPSDFIYVFENDGLIYHLDKYVFTTVCKYIQNWLHKGVKVLPISINLSRSSLYKFGLIDEYVNIAKKYEVPLKYVPLELTETTAYKTGEIKAVAEQFKKAGFPIHMDDFGTGTSSLASLNILPFDVVKIDKSVIDYIGTDDGNEMLRHMIELAHYKKIEVVAEGVENQDQLDFLNDLDCDIIQGYLYSPPISYDDLVEKYKELYNKNMV